MAGAVEKGGIVELKEVYQLTTNTTYKTDKAVRKVMQLPVVVLTAGAKQKRLFVTEYVKDFDYNKLINHLNLAPSKASLNLTKEKMREICSLASTEKDRTLIKYVAIKAQKLNTTKTTYHANQTV